ncbi:DNA-directed RNA polymerase, subunit 2 [Artemisia annua]|uniref:DNA-directed RNA polymerase, subunit 2 n=1 Tax=Artemisia annua TaxID=35608 RepID=A0A2U1LBV3_ARTAN|nr:DNA-directed RNA polymerase, subunit 2 [Artemisia annua]
MARGNIYAALKHSWTLTPQNLVNSTPLTDTYKVFFRYTQSISRFSSFFKVSGFRTLT